MLDRPIAVAMLLTVALCGCSSVSDKISQAGLDPHTSISGTMEKGLTKGIKAKKDATDLVNKGIEVTGGVEGVIEGAKGLAGEVKEKADKVHNGAALLTDGAKEIHAAITE